MWCGRWFTTGLKEKTDRLVLEFIFNVNLSIALNSSYFSQLCRVFFCQFHSSVMFKGVKWVILFLMYYMQRYRPEGLIYTFKYSNTHGDVTTSLLFFLRLSIYFLKVEPVYEEPHNVLHVHIWRTLYINASIIFNYTFLFSQKKEISIKSLEILTDLRCQITFTKKSVSLFWLPYSAADKGHAM